MLTLEIATGPAPIPDDAAHEHAGTGDVVLIARENGMSVGGAAYHALAPGVCALRRLHAVGECAEAGLPRRLCYALMRMARRDGYTRMRVTATENIEAQLALFASLGFERTTGTLCGDIDLSTLCANAAHYEHYVALVNAGLGITDSQRERQSLPRVHEACELADVGHDMFDRPQRLAAEAARAWQALCDQARGAGLQLRLVSAFRSVEYQAALIAQKCADGRGLDDVLSVNAAPGHSEHHAGTAVDLTDADTEPLTEAFELTDTFRWLQHNALGFTLSYGRDNPHALVYEPWHWRWISQGQI